MQFESMQDILDYAISLEQAAVKLYTDLAEKTDRPAIRKAFLGFANEERGHEQRLKGVKEGQRALPAPAQILDLKIVELHSGMPEITASSPYGDILLFAMRQEKHAFMLYTELAARATDPDIQTLFEQLAQEEAKHKLRFEIEYDEHVLKEN
jgi:rubrerythrin